MTYPSDGQHIPTSRSTHWAKFLFGLHSTLSALLAFGISALFALPFEGLWAVLTSVLVIHVTFGGSLRAMLRYLIGTVGGAIYAGAIAIGVPHVTPLGQAVALALAIGPLSLAAAFNPSFRVAPFSGVMVLIGSGQFNEDPIASGLYRSLEVAIGGAVAVFVSLLVFPERTLSWKRGSILPEELRSSKKTGQSDSRND
jgi:uncharacterized membrane protein YccC